ncbi:RbsD/FucU domain-containing protein [Luteolibacter marinus]|uniref:RbsD/FucU domain-containing protein n=1 Tax=Luteolibacter marinus TaxID=2776705 RepID=UPI0018680C5F|nr:RbsD/FucU domain-containing protein [Luteolibacter marinus]
MFSRVRACLLLLLPLVLAGCGYMQPEDDWRAALASQTGKLGYRNWIVVAEASFPAHSRPGVRQMTSSEEIPAVVDEVLKTLELTEHVTPRVYVARELRAVENDYAPGIDEFRRQLQASMHAHETTELEQQSLLTLIEDATRSFNVLVIRTTTALPYTSVFMELQPGYWNSDSEARLREQLDRQRMEKLARPIP